MDGARIRVVRIGLMEAGDHLSRLVYMGCDGQKCFQIDVKEKDLFNVAAQEWPGANGA